MSFQILNENSCLAHFGFVKVDTTTKSGDVEFKTNVAHNLSTAKMFGALDVKYRLPQYGTTITEKWNSDNVLSTELIVEDKIMKGMKLVMDSSYAPTIGLVAKEKLILNLSLLKCVYNISSKRAGRVKCEYRHQEASINAEVNADGTGGPLFNGAAVVGRNGVYLGVSAGYDPSKSKMTHHQVGIVAEKNDFGVHSYMLNNNEFGGNIYHKVNGDLELAANMSWMTGEQTTRFGVAAKYNVDKDTILRTKINNNSQLGVALTHAFKPSLKGTISAVVNLNENSHKLGLGLEFTN
uniref:Voltage-dependent anion-selective channel n=1 Tax=Romanomermis culicivorax TaxID=13658 RepID=A0A915I878_ROMCU